MKTTVNSIILIFSLLTGITQFNSCRRGEGAPAGPCPPPDTSSCYLRSSDLVKVPYHLQDSIVLQYDSGGAVYNFISKKVDTAYFLYQDEPQGCPGDFQKWQFINRTYSCSAYQYPLYVKQYLTDCYSCAIDVYFDTYHFGIDCSTIRTPYEFPLITINGKSYQNVVKLTKSNDSTQYVLYNTTYGILQIVSNGKRWKLVPQ